LVNQAQRRHLDGQLVDLGLEQRAFHAQDVAQVVAAEGFHRFLAKVVQGDVDLDAAVGARARGVLQGRKRRLLAGFALEHHAAGQHHLLRLGFELLAGPAAIGFRQVGGLVLRDEIVREGDAFFAYGGQLGAALGDDLVVVKPAASTVVLGFVLGFRCSYQVFVI
jgi:hypothetical protein